MGSSQCPKAQTVISCELSLKNTQHGIVHPSWPPCQVANRGKWSQVSQTYSSGLGESEGWGEGGSQGPTLAEASPVPRAAQQAPCRAGSPELLQRAGSCEASSGKLLFDLHGSSGSHFLHPRMPAPEGPQRSQSPTPLDRWGQWGPERHRVWSRSDREWGVGGGGGASEDQCPGSNACPGPPPLLNAPPVSPPSVGSQQGGSALWLFPFSLLWGIHFLPQPSKFKGPGMAGRGTRTAQGREWVFKSQRRLYPLRF